MQVLRAPRHCGDRLIGLLRPVLRYRCASAACGWEGLLPRPRVAERVSTYHGRQVLEASSADCSNLKHSRQPLP